MSTPPLKIDDSNRRDHFYLKPEHECFFFYEFTARKPAAHSQGNQLILNLKKPISESQKPHYKWKISAISQSASLLNEVFKKASATLSDAVVCPIPPSKVISDPNYDDRMLQIAQKACVGTKGICLEILRQTQSYQASHLQQDGQRAKPADLEAIYQVSAPPKPIVILIDDMLTTGAHFVAARDSILKLHPDTRVIGFFMARRALADPADDFDVAF
jgi:predicted amidophosphoribosyltransferase